MRCIQRIYSNDHSNTQKTYGNSPLLVAIQASIADGPLCGFTTLFMQNCPDSIKVNEKVSLILLNINMYG